MTWHTYDTLINDGLWLALLLGAITALVGAHRLDKARSRRKAAIHHPASVGSYVHVRLIPREPPPPYDWQLVGDTP